MYDIVIFLHEHFILSMLWLFFLIFSLFFIIKSLSFKDKTITNIQAIRLINKKNAIVIDTRSTDQFNKGHIVNSIHILLKDIFLGHLQTIESYRCYPIILILDDMNSQKECLEKFIQSGFNDIYFLKNGIYYWSLDNLPLVIKDK